jgi:fimbrial chaperone protein
MYYLNFIQFSKFACQSLICGLLFQASPLVMAGQFSINPLRIFVAPRDRATAITISNEGTEPLIMTAELYDWKQDAKGEQVLTLTEDLLLSPPVIKIPPKTKQVVRLALLKPRLADEQMTYRIILTELIEAKIAKSDEMVVPITYAFSLPIFITPRGVSKNVGCQVTKAGDGGSQVQCENTGNAYSHVSQFELKTPAGEKIASQETGGYLLAGVKRSFALKPAAAAPLQAGPAKLVVRLEDSSTQTFDVTIPQ